MPNYVLSTRSYLLATTNGVISFVKGEPTWVPPHMEKDAVHIGAECVDGEGAQLLDAEERLPDIPQGGDREQQLFIAFDLLVDRNESSDFTAQGVPTVKSVEKIVGFDVDRSEIQEQWPLYKQKGA